MRTHRAWTIEEIEYLKTNYGKLKNSEICNFLNISYHEMRRQRRKLSLKYKGKYILEEKWSTEDIYYLKNNYGKIPTNEIAQKLNRKITQVRGKIQSLDIHRENHQKPIKWTDEEILFLKNNYGKFPVKELATHLNKTSGSVRVKANQINLFFDELDEEEIKKKIAKNGFKLLSNYTTIENRHDIECKCGKIFQASIRQIIYEKKKSCGCLIGTNLRTGTENVSGKWLNRIMQGARNRGLDFTITAQDIEDLLQKQNFRCALSNIEIVGGGYKNSKKFTASVDRIDSSKGYHIDNIQLVHKHINLMKQGYSQEQFINYCKEVAKHNAS